MHERSPQASLILNTCFPSVQLIMQKIDDVDMERELGAPDPVRERPPPDEPEKQRKKPKHHQSPNDGTYKQSGWYTYHHIVQCIGSGFADEVAKDRSPTHRRWKGQGLDTPCIEQFLITDRSDVFTEWIHFMKFYVPPPPIVENVHFKKR